jgi:hypothetical protein
MSTYDTEGWFVLYVAWCTGLIASNGWGLGMFALVAGTIGYCCLLKLANELFQSAACHAEIRTDTVHCAAQLATR